MNLRDDRGAFADRGRDALGGARPDIADGEHAGMAGLERQNSMDAGNHAAILGPGRDEAVLVGRDTAFEPADIRIRADEQEKMAKRTPMRRAGVAVREDHRGQAME